VVCTERAQRATCGGSARRKRGGLEEFKGRRRLRLARSQLHRVTLEPHGGVAEWFKAAVLKTAVPETVPGVQIPPPPPLVAFAALQICAFGAPALGSPKGARRSA
jgi:hypothetical protein